MAWGSKLRAQLRSTPLYPTYMRVKYRLSSTAREELFTGYFRENVWGDPESVSGSGSSLAGSAMLREALPPLLRELGIRSLLDIPCGDFAWMQHLDLEGITYTGADIVNEMVTDLQLRFGVPGRRFIRLDLISDDIPAGFDAIMVRDLFLHLPNAMVHRAIEAIRSSGAKWMLASTYTDVAVNEDIMLGHHRFVDLTLPPFGLPVPFRLLDDPDIDREDKQLGVWRIGIGPAADL